MSVSHPTHQANFTSVQVGSYYVRDNELYCVIDLTESEKYALVENCKTLATVMLRVAVIRNLSGKEVTILDYVGDSSSTDTDTTAN
jgi:hypothetical protein